MHWLVNALNAVTGDFSEAIRAAGHVLAINGRIFPSTNESVSLVAELDDGERVWGETNISKVSSRIRRVRLDPPNCEPPEDALEALSNADVVLIGPGSLYTSLVPNLLVPGVVEAIKSSGALVVYLSNMMTQPGETTGYTLAEHVRALLEHAPALELSHVLANSAPVPDETLARYREEGAVPVQLSDETALPCPLVLADLLHPGPVLRHDGVKCAHALKSLFKRTRVRAAGARS